MIVCTVQIWFILHFFQESGNPDAIFKGRRRKKETKLAGWFWH